MRPFRAEPSPSLPPSAGPVLTQALLRAQDSQEGRLGSPQGELGPGLTAPHPRRSGTAQSTTTAPQTRTRSPSRMGTPSSTCSRLTTAGCTGPWSAPATRGCCRPTTWRPSEPAGAASPPPSSSAFHSIASSWAWPVRPSVSLVFSDLRQLVSSHPPPAALAN